MAANYPVPQSNPPPYVAIAAPSSVVGGTSDADAKAAAAAVQAAAARARANEKAKPYVYEKPLELRFGGGVVNLSQSHAALLRQRKAASADVKIQHIQVEGATSGPVKASKMEIHNPTLEEIKKAMGDASVKFLAHTVTPEDTDITSLAVRYYTSEELIRRYNRRCVFDTLDNVMGETLQIPVHTTDFDLPPPDAKAEEERKRREKVLKFQRHVSTIGQCHESEAMFYLDENGWDVSAAAQQFREDMEWAAAHPDPNRVELAVLNAQAAKRPGVTAPEADAKAAAPASASNKSPLLQAQGAGAAALPDARFEAIRQKASKALQEANSKPKPVVVVQPAAGTTAAAVPAALPATVVVVRAAPPAVAGLSAAAVPLLSAEQPGAAAPPPYNAANHNVAAPEPSAPSAEELQIEGSPPAPLKPLGAAQAQPRKSAAAGARKLVLS